MDSATFYFRPETDTNLDTLPIDTVQVWDAQGTVIGLIRTHFTPDCDAGEAMDHVTLREGETLLNAVNLP